MTSSPKKGPGRPAIEKEPKKQKMPLLPFDEIRKTLSNLLKGRGSPAGGTCDVQRGGDLSSFANEGSSLTTSHFSNEDGSYSLRVELSEEQQRKRMEYIQARVRHGTSGLANNSRRGLASDWINWLAFCAYYNRTVLPTSFDDLRDFIDILIAGGRQKATIEHHLWTIAKINRRYGCANPMDNDVAIEYWRDTLRDSLSADQKQATGLTFDVVESLVSGLEASSITPRARKVRPENKPFAIEAQRRRVLRDIALIHVMYDLLARSDELVRMEWSRVTKDGHGAGTYRMGKSKSDQEGKGQSRYLRPATMDALEAWRSATSDDGYIFHGVAEWPNPAHGEGDQLEVERRRQAAAKLENGHLSTQEITSILRRAAKLAGIKAPTFTGHSARVGATQDMVLAGATTEEVKRAGGWTSDRMPTRYAANALAQMHGESRFDKISKMVKKRKAV